jgi:hypothetical protein
MSLPGFTAESSLGRASGTYRHVMPTSQLGALAQPAFDIRGTLRSSFCVTGWYRVCVQGFCFWRCADWAEWLNS